MLSRVEIMQWLAEQDPTRLKSLWKLADETRRRHVGDEVHLRGLVEFSNHCVRRCAYCGLRAPNTVIERYRLSVDEVLSCAEQATELGYGTVVLQSGEDEEITVEWVEEVVRRIKAGWPLAVTLSLGEREPEELERWKAAGADRYLLRFETSSPRLFKAIHPPRRDRPVDRLELLRELRGLGYEVGSGFMVGIPGQSWDDLASDVLLARELDLDMIGVGPYIPHPQTPLGQHPERWRLATDEQAAADELTTLKVIALVRLSCPTANIPSTTALATLNPKTGRERGLQVGANVIMPNVSPLEFRARYQIYPNKACISDAAETCHHCVHIRIQAIGRVVGQGRGDSPNHQQRLPLPAH